MSKNLPMHLRKNATYLQCDSCGRKSYSGELYEPCNFPAPDGNTCQGYMQGIQSENAKLKEELVAQKGLNPDQSFIIKAMNDELVIKCNEIERLKEMLERMANALWAYSDVVDDGECTSGIARSALAEYQKWKKEDK